MRELSSKNNRRPDTDSDTEPHRHELEGEEGGDQKQLLCGPQLPLEDGLSELPQEEEEV